MKKITIISACVILLIAIAGGLFLFGQFQNQSLGTIKYGYQDWPGVLPYLIAYEKGFYKNRGLDVVLVKEDSYVKELEDLISGAIDFSGDVALIDVVKRVSKGVNLSVVLATDYSNGADGFVANSSVKSITGLKGKNVSVEMDTLGEYLLYEALKKDNLKLTDIKEVNLSAQDAAQAFIDKKVDAAVSYGPNLSRAVTDGDGAILYSSANSPGLIIDVLAFRSDFVKNNPAKVSAVVGAYADAMDFIEKNPGDAYTIGAKYFGISVEALTGQLKGIKLMSISENMDLMSFGSGKDSIHGLINNAYDFLKLKGDIVGDIDTTEIVDHSYVRGIM
ncbi:MAG: ABC transporter substrate-binding protein [Candidatus Taylorbacteria bacterium]